MTLPAIRLLRDLFRKTRLLPKKSQDYYKVHIRENYIAHNDETEPSRIAEIVDKAYKDADWIAQKYGQKKS